MINKKIFNIFKLGSKTYFYSSLFFPKKIKEDVFILYAFVRVADDLVDSIPQKTNEYIRFKKEYQYSYKGGKSNNIVINAFVDLEKRCGFDHRWVLAFFDSQESDLHTKEYKTIMDTEKYIYGSAEVIGLMMAKVLNLPVKSYLSAKFLGKAMQYANFIRDIKVDCQLGRLYFPKNELKEQGLECLCIDSISDDVNNFQKYLRSQIKRYYKWQNEAEKGFKYIPKRFRIAIKTASDMYKWTVSKIDKNPEIVFSEQIKPSYLRIILTGVKNMIGIYLGLDKATRSFKAL
jgi:15-cis-phytoene synthase